MSNPPADRCDDEDLQLFRFILKSLRLEPDFCEPLAPDELQLDGNYSLAELEAFVEAMRAIQMRRESSEQQP